MGCAASAPVAVHNTALRSRKNSIAPELPIEDCDDVQQSIVPAYVPVSKTLVDSKDSNGSTIIRISPLISAKAMHQDSKACNEQPPIMSPIVNYAHIGMSPSLPSTTLPAFFWFYH